MSDLIDKHVPDEPAYTFLNEHSHVVKDGEESATCKSDGQIWPCSVARAFLAGRRTGLDIAAERMEALAGGFTDVLEVQRVRQVTAHLRVDVDEIDQVLQSAS